MRRRRWTLLLEAFPNLKDMRVLDLGGTTIYWARAPVRPEHVTVINLETPGEPVPGVRPLVGDACHATDLVGDESFDLVLSNSLIEHLGGHAARQKFADAVAALAPRYIVQTPYRYFPVEPHWLFPGMQFLPLKLRIWLAPRWPLGHTYKWKAEDARKEVLFTELLSASQMRHYFPDATIVWERIGGVPKSMLAIRTDDE
jgi:hypothetical protein